MINIISLTPVRCKRCHLELLIEPKDYGEPKIREDERKAGYETYYGYRADQKCLGCGNEINVTLDCYEYPSGQINHIEMESMGCAVLKKPKLELVPTPNTVKGGSSITYPRRVTINTKPTDNFTIEVHLLSQSKPILHENPINAYIKEGMYCVRMDKDTYKYPMVNIFRVTEKN